MASVLEDLDCQGNLSCNNCTVRGSLTVAGIPLSIGLNFQEEGVGIVGNPHQTGNFIGPGVTVADAGAGVASITIAPPVLQEEGVPIAGAPHQTINYIGGGVTVANVGGGVASVTVPGTTYQQAGVPLAGAPHTVLNGGTGIVITDAGAGVALIEGGMDILIGGIAIAGNPKDTIDFVGNGVDATDAPPDTAVVTIRRNAVLSWGALDINNAADSRFLAPGFIAAAPLTDSMQLPVPFVGDTTLRCLFVRHGLAIGDGDPVDYTVFVNGIATALTVSLATGAVGQASDLVNTVAVVQGDRVSIQATKALDITSGAISVTATLVLD